MRVPTCSAGVSGGYDGGVDDCSGNEQGFDKGDAEMMVVGSGGWTGSSDCSGNEQRFDKDDAETMVVRSSGI